MDIFDTFNANGMQLMLDANKCSNPDAMGYWSDALGKYTTGWNRDCVMGTDFWDEPTKTSDIDTIASYIEAYEEAFAGKQFFVNLMPSSSSTKCLLPMIAFLPSYVVEIPCATMYSTSLWSSS